MKGGVETVIGYKEWDAICEALGTGRQCVLLRKGGIHEGRSGFSFKHDEFLLFPTRFHAQAEMVRVPVAGPSRAGEWEVGEEVTLRYRCEALWARTLTDWEQVRRLEPFHVWSEEVVRDRYDCGEEQQIHCALVRVHALAEPLVVPYQKKYGGCRTWIDLDCEGVGPFHTTPVIPDEEFAVRRAEVEAILASS